MPAHCTTAPARLMALVDAYATAAATRARHADAAPWAFLDAHRAMLAARADVAAALGLEQLAPLTGDLDDLAAGAEHAEHAWHARIDAALAGSDR